MTCRLAHPSAQLMALLLMCALLLAQWAGVQHRIAHAHFQQAGYTHADTDFPTKNGKDKSAFHSCILLDANAMGAGLPGCASAPLLKRVASLPISVLPPVSWQALFIRQFSSRAPPSLS